MTSVQQHYLPTSKNAPVRKRKPNAFATVLNSTAMKYLTWLAVALVISYRLLTGQFFALGICLVAAGGCLLLKENWQSIPKKQRYRIVFGLGLLLGWVSLTVHAPAHAIFFDTIETGLTTIFNTFGVTGYDKIPKWVGGVFRILAIVFLAIIGLRFGQQRDSDEEGVKHLVARIVPWLAGLLILDALIELVVQGA